MSELRHSIFDALDPSSTKATARIVRTGIRGAACVGVLAAILRTMPATAGSEAVFEGTTLVVLGCMLVVYALHVYAAPSGPRSVPGRDGFVRFRYAFSAVGLVDAVSVAPMVFAIALGEPPETWSLFGVLWVLKLARTSTNLAVLMRVLEDARKPLLSVLLLFGTVLVLAATAAYLIEGENQLEAFGSIPRALWWGIATLTTTGYGDEVPMTTVGRVLAGTVMLSGIAVMALWAGILANGFSEELKRRDFLETWNLVARVPFFQDVGAAAIAEVARLLHPRKYFRGSKIFWKGQRGNCMYFIVSGEVQVKVSGRAVPYGAGEFFGEVALVSGGRRTGTAVAKESCMLLILDITDFHELARNQPELSRAIRSKAAVRIERSETGRDDIH